MKNILKTIMSKDDELLEQIKIRDEIIANYKQQIVNYEKQIVNYEKIIEYNEKNIQELELSSERDVKYFGKRIVELEEEIGNLRLLI